VSATTDILRQIDLFAELSEAELAQLEQSAHRRPYRRGQVIFGQGEAGGSLCIVEAGRVNLLRISDDGKQLVVRVVGPGEFFGELALLDGAPRSADAEALDDCRLLHIARDGFVRIVETRPSVGLALLGALARRLRATTDLLESMVFDEVPARLIRLLLDLARPTAGGPDGRVVVETPRVTQAQLGMQIGATRESVNHSLGALERRDLIRQEGGRITIQRPEELRRLIQ
jgi:CRP-like cAMP-binding protein